MMTTRLIKKTYLAWKDRILPLFENVNLLDHISTAVEEPQKFNIVGDRKGNQPTQLRGKNDYPLERLISGTLTPELHGIILMRPKKDNLGLILRTADNPTKVNQFAIDYLTTIESICDCREECYAMLYSSRR